MYSGYFTCVNRTLVWCNLEKTGVYEIHHCDVTTTQQECRIETKVGCSLDRVGV